MNKTDSFHATYGVIEKFLLEFQEGLVPLFYIYLLHLQGFGNLTGGIT
ncbi:hypothetical protein [Flavobacterium branchiophilum]|nr:hypothetical protein [Flavobacterium branchiophilum]